MSNIKAISGGLSLELNPQTLHYSIATSGGVWSWDADFRPSIKTAAALYCFTDARSVTHTAWKTGVGQGIRSTFRNLYNETYGDSALSFETVVWIEDATGHVTFEFVPLTEDASQLEAVYWPGPMSFDEPDGKWYTVLNQLQGLLLPNDWRYEVSEEKNRLNFNGQFCSTAAYMPWWGQVRPGGGYMAICLTPWDGAYSVNHPAKGPYTRVQPRWLESMGKISYRRALRYQFFKDCDYNDLCKAYRLYAKETGLFVTLQEKAARCPAVDRLIGSAVVHKGIKTHFAFRQHTWPDTEDRTVPFSHRTAQIKKLKESGVEKLYLHLDGWGQPGYDNQHPDYLPACEEAGGWAGMKELADTVHDCGYLFGIHDQYRDYYFDAATFDPECAIRTAGGEIFEQTLWAGGRQSFLCATQAPYYLRRNFQELWKNEIKLDAAYLDVFTCNEGDECTNPLHAMTRKECFEYRTACFRFLLAHGILSSSEEVVDWSVPSLVFAHYGPYDFMLQQPDDEPRGIPVPLFNLVYHECVILPWLMNKSERFGDYMLYALLNGGGAYLNPSADDVDEEIRRWRIVAELQERVAKMEMLRHTFLDENFRQEQTVFEDGTAVTVDHDAQTWKITRQSV